MHNYTEIVILNMTWIFECLAFAIRSDDMWNGNSQWMPFFSWKKFFIKTTDWSWFPVDLSRRTSFLTNVIEIMKEIRKEACSFHIWLSCLKLKFINWNQVQRILRTLFRRNSFNFFWNFGLFHLFNGIPISINL